MLNLYWKTVTAYGYAGDRGHKLVYALSAIITALILLRTANVLISNISKKNRPRQGLIISYPL